MATSSSVGTEALFRRHAPFVARFLLRMGTSPQDVDDLVQEVFIIAHRSGGYVAGPARPTTWLATIAFGVSSSNRRTRRRHPEHLTDDPNDYGRAPGGSPHDAAETAQALARVQSAVDRLDPERRIVFVLFELEGEPCDAIAAALGIPVGTVYSRLHTARKEFTAAIERLQAADQPPPRMLRTAGTP